MTKAEIECYHISQKNFYSCKTTFVKLVTSANIRLTVYINNILYDCPSIEYIVTVYNFSVCNYLPSLDVKKQSIINILYQISFNYR